MSTSTLPGLFDDETLEMVNGRLCRKVEDPDDELFGYRWEPVDGAPVECPVHKAKPGPDETFIRRNTATFRKKAKEHMEERGYMVYPVDRFNFKSQRTNDLYGLFDMEAFRASPCVPGTEETVMVQICSKSGLGSHITKMCAHEPVGKNDKTWRVDYLRRFLEAGRLVLLLGFYKGMNSRWLVEERWLTIEMVNEHEPRRRKAK